MSEPSDALKQLVELAAAAGLAARALKQVERINRGEVACAITGDWGYWGYCGYCDFVDADGWRYRVFNDCDEFDYFDEIKSPTGEVLDFDTMWEVYDEARGRLVSGPLINVCADIDDEHRARWGVPE